MKWKTVRTKRALALMLAAVLTAGMMPSAKIPALAAEGVMKQFYLSPDGDDGNDGSEAKPFRTMERARQAVAKINSSMTGDIVVNIAPGDYYMNETVNYTWEDSGSNGFEIIYRCSGNPGTARFIGGDEVAGEWKPVDQNDVTGFDLPADMLDKVYKVQLDPDTYDFNTLYVNGTRATMARTLNRENNPRFVQADDEYMISTGGETYGIYYDQSVLPQSAVDGIVNALARGEEGAQVYGWDWNYRNWFTSTIPVTSINAGSGRLYFSPDPENPAANRPKYVFSSGARFYLQGNLAFLDSPGEYHYNKKTGVLYYYPEPGEEDLGKQEIIVPTLQELFHLQGEDKAKVTDTPDPEKQVHNITFQGIFAGYTEFTDSYSSGWNSFDAQGGIGRFPEEALEEGITNPSFCEQTDRPEFQKGAFTMIQTNNITLDMVKINYTGLSGVVIWKDNHDITVKNSEIAYNGFNGISIDGGYPGPKAGKYAYHITITNNILHDVGELVGHGTCLAAMQVHDSEFSHMEMYNAPRRAIFLTAGWARRRPEDANFNRYTDSATYENHLEYLYLHDLQQDGGDDGAIFLCTLYRYQSGPGDGYNDTKPNYLNQIYMDNVGAAASTKDFKPNCINFDMGCGGVVASNIKAVNPQHYNIRYNEGQGEVTFNNVNMAYYHPMPDSNYTNFDESKMEYDKIGVDKASYPYDVPVRTADTYEDVYYRDEFDNGLDDWWKLAGQPGTTPLYYSDNDDFGGSSFLADAFYNSSTEGCLIGKPFGTDLNKVVEIDFFDHMNDGMENGYCGMSFQYRLNSFARVDDGEAQRAIGVDHSTSEKNYSYKIGSITKVSDIRREYGWHTFRWDYTDGSNVKMYIDDKLITSAPAESFSYIEMGDYGQGGFNAYDNVVIYGGSPADPPIALPAPPAKEDPVEKVKELPGRIEAEDADKLPSTIQLEDISGGNKAIAYISKGDVYEYKINVTEDMELPFAVSYAGNGQADFKVLVDDEEQFAVNLPHTGGWTTYKELVTDKLLAMTAGEHTLKIQVVNNNFNLDSFGCFVPDEEVQVEEIVTSVKDPMILGIGNAVKAPYQVLPANAADQSVKWSTTDDGAVITVAADGTITAKGEGEADVTVSSVSNPEVGASFQVKVENPEASLISKAGLGCTASANVDPDHPDYGAKNLIDGRINAGKSGWNALGAAKPGGREDPSAYLEWTEPQTVKSIYIYDIAEGGNYVERMEIIFNDDQDSKVVLENGVPDGGMEKVTLDEAIENVTKIEFHILKASAPYKNYGFEEIKVFSGVPGEVPVNSISFGSGGVTLFPDGTYTLTPPAAVPSTATNSKLTVEVVQGQDVIRFRANISDGITRNYTITALKLGKAVIRATAENGVYADFTVTVGSRELLEDKIIEAENLYAKFPGESDAHKAFKAVIDEALKVYNNSKDLNEYTKAVEKLEKAMEVFRDAASPEETAQEIADGLVLENPSRGDTQLKKPEVPFGFKVDIQSVSPEGVVDKNWAIQAPDQDEDIQITLLVTRITDKQTGTRVCTITVPGYSAQEVLDCVTIPQPEKKAEALTLPQMPYGYRIEIVSSTEDRIAADGKITWPLAETEVTAKVRVTKTSDNSYAEKDFQFTLQGIGKAWGVPIEANDIDALNGSYIKVQNNEVVNFNPGNWIRYDNVDFGAEDQLSSLYIETAVHPSWEGKTIEVVLDDIKNGQVIGSIVVEAFGNDWGIYGTQEAVLSTALSGYHTIYLRGVDGGNRPGEGVGGVRTIRLDVPSEIPAKTYPVTIDTGIVNGTVAADKAEAKAGENVIVTVTPAEGCRLEAGSLKVTKADGAEVEVTGLEDGGYGFTMPEEAVTITAKFAEIVKYNITVSANDAMGSIIPDKSEAEEGEEVTVTVSSGDGYYLVEDSLKANDVPIEGRKFTMPGMDVLITAVFEALPPAVYTVDIIPAAGGTVTASPMAAPAGTQVALTVTPDEGYQLTAGSLSVTAADGTSVEVTAENTFAMPEGNVTVTAAFEKIPTDFTGLQEVYDRYKDLTQGNYTDATWNAFMLKKLAAEVVLGNKDATQAEIDTAKADLEEAYGNLEEKPATGNIYRDLLQKTYDYARDLSTEGVVDSAVKQFQDALAKAGALLENQQATDAQLEEAFNALLDGIWGLGLTKGDKTTLELLIARAELMAADQDKYVAAQWQLLLDKLAKAKEVMGNGDAMEEDIKPAADELLDAILKQRFKASKDILQDIINKAEAVDESLYTEESVQVFRAAFAYAKEILNDQTLSEDDQDTVDQAAEGLEAAIMNLEEKEEPDKPTDPSDPSNPTDPTDPSGPDNPGGSEDPGAPDDSDSPADPSVPSDDPGQPSDDGSSSSSAEDDGTVVSPKTGDHSNMALAVSVAAMGMVIVGAAVLRRKKED